MNRANFLSICTLLLLVSGAKIASAVPVFVDPDTDGSSVEITVDGDCRIDCWANTELADSLALGGRDMEVGDKWVFDFFEITVGGLGSAEAMIQATLAFIAPDIFSTSTGHGRFFTFLGWFSAGTLEWDQPDSVELDDGTFLTISFENLHELGFGNSTMVSAAVSRVAAVPEPGTLALLGIGLLAVALVARSRRRKP